MNIFSENELKFRISKFQKYLKEKKIKAAVLTQNSDIYYYTGSCEPLYLVIQSENPAFMLSRKAASRIRSEVKHIKLFEFYNTSDLSDIFKNQGLLNSNSIGFTLDTVSYATVERFKKIMNFSELIDVSSDVRMLRICKSEAELNIQIQAGKIASYLPELVRKVFKFGMTELELSAEIEKYFRLNGGNLFIRCRKEGVECIGVCSSGTNTLAGTKFDGICSGLGVSPASPYGANRDVIKKNSPVIIDFGFSLNGYIVDITRMFCCGAVSESVMNAYNSMLEIEKAILNLLKPGIKWSDIYDLSLDMAIKAGYEKEFMGCGFEKVRFVGHGIGLELDEPPFLAPKQNYLLEENMVVAVEPKVALENTGVVGIENSYIIRKNNCEIITDCSNEFIVV